MDFRLVGRAKNWIALASLLVCAHLLLSLLLPHGSELTLFGDITQCFLLLSATLTVFSNAIKAEGRTRIFWALMSSGFGMWLWAQALWTYFEVFLHHEVPNPFLGDVILFLHIVPMMGALAVRPHVERDVARFDTLDFLLLLAWWLYLFLFLVIPWQYVYPNEVVYGHSFDALYLSEHLVFLLCLTLVWQRSTEPWRTIYRHLFGAALLYAFSSIAASVAIDYHLYYTGSLYDVPLVAAMAWFAGVGLMATNLVQKGKPAKKAAAEPGIWAARLARWAVFSTPLMVAWAEVGGQIPPRVRTYRLLLTVDTMLVMGFLVFLKQHLLNRELIYLLRASAESLDKQKRLQAQLVQSEKLASLNDILAGAAHEINNPLTAILGYSDLIVDTDQSREEQRASAEKIRQQARRTKALISDLLSFSRQVCSEKTLVGIDALVTTAVKLCQAGLSGRGVQLQLFLGEDLSPVLGNSAQLLQVFLHIIRNSIDALEPASSSVLVVKTLQQAEYVIVEFSDNGPGLREPERVFDPFYTTKPIGKGTGLGLSASYGIVQDHGGRISCQNRSAGGATFRVELPMARDATDQVGERTAARTHAVANHSIS